MPFAQDYRGPDAREALEALQRALVTQVAAETVAAIVIEPVQGEGGFIVAPQEFMTGVRRICDDNGIVLIVDEVQTGFGRTGRFFAIEHSGVEPDLADLPPLMALPHSPGNVVPVSDAVGRKVLRVNRTAFAGLSIDEVFRQQSKRGPGPSTIPSVLRPGSRVG